MHPGKYQFELGQSTPGPVGDIGAAPGLQMVALSSGSDAWTIRVRQESATQLAGLTRYYLHLQSPSTHVFNCM